MKMKQPSRLHYFRVQVGFFDGTSQALRVVARDPLEAIRVGEDLVSHTKNAKRILHSSAVQQLDPLFEPLTTVN